MTFTEFIEGLEKRPGMWMKEATIEAVSAYLFGYQTCCFVHDLDDPLDGMHELIQCRLGRPCSIGWTYAIRQFLTEDEESAIRLIFSSIHDLQRLKTEKGRDWLRSEFDRMRKLKRARPVNLSWPLPASRRH
jgi:hypothetical protein